GTRGLFRRVSTLDGEIDDLDLRSLGGLAVRAGLLRCCIILDFGTYRLDVEVREQPVRELEAAAELRHLRFIRAVALDHKAVAGLLDTLEKEARDHRDPLAHRVKHGARAGLRCTEPFD